MTACIAFLFMVFSIFSISSSAANVKWFDQKLDHFNHEIIKTWKQKYYQSSEYYRTGGPVFLQIGGEGPANPIWMEQGHWIEIAKEVGAMCFMLEHRYYGDSHPTTNTSVENLQFLTSEQALADIAEFIHYFMADARLKTWISFGGSYSGSLSLWARLKYPHLIHGSVSASAPLLAKLDFQEYNEVVKRSLTDYGRAECVDSISIATKTVETMLKTDTGRLQLNKIFQLCHPLQPEDYEYFQNTIADPIAETVQYNRDGSKGNVTITTICEHMTNTKLGTEVERYASLSSLTLLERFDIRVFFKRFRQANDARGSCLDASYKTFIKENQNPVFNAGRTWVFQTCTEFGWFQSTDSAQQPFRGFPVDFFTDMCQKLYGSQYNKTDIQTSIKATNANYGEKDISEVLTNAILFNGGVDPWHALSYVNSQYEAEHRENFQTVFVPSAAHCAVMYPRKPNDPPELNDARDKITAYVKKILK